jgi:hypothetical protein
MAGILTALLFVLVGLVNITPVIGVLGAAQLEALYGQPFTDHGLLLLLRHRAVLFGLLGGLLILAAFRPSLRKVATVAGTLSMASFCLLALPLESHDQVMQRVFWIDVIAIALLILAWWLSRKTVSGRS